MSRQKRPDSYSLIQKAIGERCRWVLDEVNPNQSDLARELEVDSSTINKYLQGSRAQSIFFIRNFARRFKLSTDYLLRGAFVGVEERSLSLRLMAAHPELRIEFGDLAATEDNSPPPATSPKKIKKVAEKTET